MDGVALAGISAGVPSLGIILLAVQIGRWQGKTDQMLKNHDEWIKGQSERCKDQKDSCGKRLDYVQGRVNHIKDE